MCEKVSQFKLWMCSFPEKIKRCPEKSKTKNLKNSKSPKIPKMNKKCINSSVISWAIPCSLLCYPELSCAIIKLTSIPVKWPKTPKIVFTWLYSLMYSLRLTNVFTCIHWYSLKHLLVVWFIRDWWKKCVRYLLQHYVILLKIKYSISCCCLLKFLAGVIWRFNRNKVFYFLLFVLIVEFKHLPFFIKI